MPNGPKPSKTQEAKARKRHSFLSLRNGGAGPTTSTAPAHSSDSGFRGSIRRTGAWLRRALSRNDLRNVQEGSDVGRSSDAQDDTSIHEHANLQEHSNVRDIGVQTDADSIDNAAVTNSTTTRNNSPLESNADSAAATITTPSLRNVAESQMLGYNSALPLNTNSRTATDTHRPQDPEYDPAPRTAIASRAFILNIRGIGAGHADDFRTACFDTRDNSGPRAHLEYLQSLHRTQSLPHMLQIVAMQQNAMRAVMGTDDTPRNGTQQGVNNSTQALPSTSNNSEITTIRTPARRSSDPITPVQLPALSPNVTVSRGRYSARNEHHLRSSSPTDWVAEKHKRHPKGG